MRPGRASSGEDRLPSLLVCLPFETPKLLSSLMTTLHASPGQFSVRMRERPAAWPASQPAARLSEEVPDFMGSSIWGRREPSMSDAKILPESLRNRPLRDSGAIIAATGRVG
jgi:hypothetical protein